MKTQEGRPISLNDEQLLLESSRVSDIYHQLTLDLFDQVIDRITARGSVSLQENPYIWQLEKMNNMGLLNDENIKLIARYSGVAEKQLRHVIESEGYKVYKNTKQQLLEDLEHSDGYIPDSLTQEQLTDLANQAMRDLDNLTNTTLPLSVRQVYQDIVNQAVASVVTGLETQDRAISQAVLKMAQRGFYGYTDAAGRAQRADSYARTIIKTTAWRAYNETRTAPARELGIDTFYYSTKAAARELCAPLQGRIVTTGPAREEQGVEILSLLDYGYGTPGGCRGINCGHVMTPFIVGVNILPDLGPDVRNITPEQAIENANDQAKQRALERMIRQSKELKHVADKLGDQEAGQKYAAKIRMQQGAMRDYLKEHPFLQRDYSRERYYENPLAQAEAEIALREQQAE